jgi:hypothetical protein
VGHHARASKFKGLHEAIHHFLGNIALGVPKATSYLGIVAEEVGHVSHACPATISTMKKPRMPSLTRAFSRTVGTDFAPKSIAGNRLTYAQEIAQCANESFVNGTQVSNGSTSESEAVTKPLGR